MEGNKLEISSGKEPQGEPEQQKATYKQIPETDVEDPLPKRSKSVSSHKSSTGNQEVDGAHEKMLPDGDQNLGHVKFISSDKERQNGDAKVDIGEIKAAFVGMGKEELMKYANDPFWVRLRWFLFISFWLLWAGMLAGAIVIIIASPKCAAPEPRTWWEQGPLTEVPVETSAEELAEIKQNGVQGIFVEWPKDPYASINESDSFLDLLAAAKQAQVKIIVKLTPATATSRDWFERSQLGTEPQYADYYIWAEGGKGVSPGDDPATAYPNNWLKKNNEPAWKYSTERKRFYYAPEGEPVLNFRNPRVVQEFADVLIGFLDAGVAGVALNGGPNLLVDKDFKSDTVGSKPGPVHTDYNFYTHHKTEYLQDLGTLLKEWRQIVKEKVADAPFILTDELKSIEPFKVNGSLVIDLPRHSNALQKQTEITAQQLEKDLNSTFKLFGPNAWPLWTFSIDEDVLPADVLETVTMLLPGVTLIKRDAVIQKELLDTRLNPSILFGTCERHVLANNTVFAYIRVASGNPGYLVAMNPTSAEVTVDFTQIPALSEEVTVQYLSKNYTVSSVKLKNKAPATNIPMSPKSAIVLTYVPKQTK